MRGLNDLFCESKIGYFADTADDDAVFRELKRLYFDFTEKKMFTPVIADNYLDNYITDEYLKF